MFNPRQDVYNIVLPYYQSLSAEIDKLPRYGESVRELQALYTKATDAEDVLVEALRNVARKLKSIDSEEYPADIT
jgi:hypothetical protein